jgi:hypothetical protein
MAMALISIWFRIETRQHLTFALSSFELIQVSHIRIFVKDEIIFFKHA